MENKRQVQHLVANSKNIVRLKPRNPEEKSSSHIMVKALCDFKQDQVTFLIGTAHKHSDMFCGARWDVLIVYVFLD